MPTDQFWPGPMNAINSALGDKLEERHKKADELKAEKRKVFLQGAMDPAASDEMRKYNWDEYGKLSDPETKKGVSKLGEHFQNLFKHAKAQQKQQPNAPPQQTPQQPYPQQAPQGPDKAPGIPTTLDPSPKQQFNQGPQQAQQPATKGPPEPGRPWYPSTADIDARTAANEKHKSDIARDAKIAEDNARPQKLTPVMVQVKGEKEPVQALRNSEGKYFAVNSGDAIEIEKEMPKENAKGGYIRSVPHSVGLKDARKQAENGAEFPDQDGNMIDLSKLPEDMGLQAMVQGNKMFWVPVTPSQRTVSVGGQVYGVNPYQVQDIGKPNVEGPATLGPSKTGSNRTSEQIAINPVTGEVTKNTLRSSTTPLTPGASQPAKAPPAGISAPTGGNAKSAPAAAPPPSSDIKGMPSGMYNQMLNRVTPVREAATQVFGDPSQPDLKGLKDYMQLADDPKARERVGTALRLTFDGLNQASSSGAHISANAGPVSVSTGGIGQVFTNMFGVPQTLAAQQSKIIQDSINKMTPEEKEYFDSVMSAFSTIVGLRSLTRASAAQSSVSAIERELPIIGVNTTDSQQFADQMQRLAEVVYNGTKGIPPGMIDPKLVDRIKNLPAEMQKMKGKSPAKAPAGKGPKTAEDYLQSIGVR